MTSLVVFELGDASYALLSGVVQEIARAVALARLPKAPAIIEGVIDVRGAIVPVIDVRRRFGLPGRPLAPDQHLVVAHAGRRLVALRVDRVREVAAVAESDLFAAEPVAPGGEHLAGIARLAAGLVVITDLGQFLGLDEARQLDAALAEGGEAS